MFPTRVENQAPARKRGKRATRRKRLMRTLRRALLFQAKFTVLLAVVARLAALILPTPAASGLLAAAFLLPAWITGLFAGAAAPRLRWWQLLCAGAVGAFTFALLSALASVIAGPGIWSPMMRCWVAANLGVDFLLAGWMGRRWRLGPGVRTLAVPAAGIETAYLEEVPVRRAG